MNEMTKDQIRDFIIYYFNTEPRDHSAKDEREFYRLIRTETDVTEDIVENDMINDSAKNRHPGYHDLLNELFINGKCKEHALDWAKIYVTDKMEFGKNDEWESSDEEALIDWLLCKTDALPKAIPQRSDLNFWGLGWLENTFGCVSHVCDFSLRYLAYSVYSATVFQFKFPFRGLLNKRGDEQASIFVSEIKKILCEDFRLDAAKADELLMRTFASCCFVSPKQKAETGFYMRYIDDWMKQDREGFVNAIESIKSNDTRKKILKGLKTD
ncbi:MAG: hypothetical protein K5921_07880 [Lachnospiraceae bacterium]|nr:hypothetical protein [Lachnospiraceae bacterium]